MNERGGVGFSFITTNMCVEDVYRPHQTVLRKDHVCEAVPSFQWCCIVQAVFLRRQSIAIQRAIAVRHWYTWLSLDVSNRRETGKNDSSSYRQIFIHRKIFAIFNIFMSNGGETGRLTGSSSIGSGSVSINRLTSFNPESSVGDVISLRSKNGNMCNKRNAAAAYCHYIIKLSHRLGLEWRNQYCHVELLNVKSIGSARTHMMRV